MKAGVLASGDVGRALASGFLKPGHQAMMGTRSAGKPTTFICGNHADAKSGVTGILDQFGWETADMGSAEAASAIEPLCMLWCIPGFLRNDCVHAFKLPTQRRPSALNPRP